MSMNEQINSNSATHNSATAMNVTPAGWGQESAAITILISVSFLIFWPFILGQVHFIGPSDTSDMILPQQDMLMRYLGNGIFPLWSPNNMAGFPLPGYPQFGIFYPINILIFFVAGKFNFDIVNVYSFCVIFHIIIFSIGNYLFARTIKLSPIPALVAAIGSAYAPAILMFTVWGNSLPGFSWWGFALGALVLAQEGGVQKWRCMALSGLSIGMCFLASPSQPAIQLIFLIAGLFISQAAQVLRQPFLLARLFYDYFIIALIGLSVGAVSLLPVMEFTNQSVRFLGRFGGTPSNERMSFEAFTESILSLKNIGGFVVHELSRQGAGSCFLGAFLTLGIVLSAVNYKNIKGKYFWYVTCVATVSILYAFNIFLPTVFYSFPGLNLIREPDRYCQTFAFGASFVAAFGVQDAFGSIVTLQMKRQIIAGLIFAALCWGLTGFSETIQSAESLLIYKIASALAVAWLVVSLLIWGIKPLRPLVFCLFLGGTLWTIRGIIPWYEISYKDYDPRSDYKSILSMASLRPTSAEPFRVFAMRDSSETARTFNSDAASVAGFYDIFGYHNPILMRSLRAYNLSFNRPNYLDLLNVRYVVSEPTGTATAQVRKVLGSDADIKINLTNLLVHDRAWQFTHEDLVVFENTHRYGAAWLVDRYDVVDRPWTNRDEIDGSKDAASLMWRTEAADFHPEREAVVDQAPHLADGRILSTSVVEPRVNSTPIEWLGYGPNGFELKVNSDRDALLVVSELWYPGWRATVNGQLTDIVRADWLLRAIAVPRGPVLVRFQYRPKSLLIGSAFCFFGFSLAIILLLPRFNRTDRELSAKKIET